MKLQRDTHSEGTKPTLGSHYIESLILNHPSMTTVWRWLRFLGYRYQATKKTYYVDGHEKEEHILSRVKLAKHYLQEIEKSTHRFVHFTRDEFLTFTSDHQYKQDEVFKIADEFEGKENGDALYELHVDDFEGLHDIANERYPLGGCMSHEHDPNNKPILILGQHECIFQQFTVHGKQWCGPNGERALMPKTDGYGIMISSFQSLEHGFGMDISE